MIDAQVFSDFLDNVRIRLPGALDGVLKLELPIVLDDFLRGSRAWQEEVTLPVIAGVTQYTITHDDGAFAYLLGAKDASDVWRAVTMQTPGVVRLRDEPAENATWRLFFIMTISRQLDNAGNPRMPGWIFERYSTDIMDGLLARLMSQDAKPYSSKPSAALHYRRFQAGIGRARSEVARQYVPGAQAWSFPNNFTRV